MSQGWQEGECGGHPVRRFPLAVSAAALALGWARQEEGPAGATVVVDREISPLGRIGKVWQQAPDKTFACAIVLRPPLAAEEADMVWLIAGLAAAEATEAAAAIKGGTWWPDDVVHPDTLEPLATVKAEVQLGPGRVRSAVVTFRFDLERMGLEEGDDVKDRLLEALLEALDKRAASMGEDASSMTIAYERRCLLVGRRVKIELLPKGSTRGNVARVDRLGRLELESSTGMVERIGVDNLRSLEVV